MFAFSRIVSQWEERRKKAVLRGFYKELEKDQQNSPQTSSDLGDTLKNANEATRYVNFSIPLNSFSSDCSVY